jgi:uncharacterized protein YciI
MFIVLLKYLKPVTEVEKHLAEHREYLKLQYDAGVFIASGRKNPRTGGVILARGIVKDDLMKLIENDPFSRENIAEYEVIEFIPNMAAAGFESLVEA